MTRRDVTLYRLRVHLVGWIAALACLVPGSAQAQTETIEYYGLDAIGSVRIVFDATGAVLGRQDYGPYGRPLFPATGLPPERFAGQPVDGEIDQGDFQAREYQMRTGRFTRVDPIYDGIFEPQRWNRYAYALNGPLTFTDPTGLTVPCQENHGGNFCFGSGNAPLDPYSQSVAAQLAAWWDSMFGPNGYVEQMRNRGSTVSTGSGSPSNTNSTDTNGPGNDPPPNPAKPAPPKEDCQVAPQAPPGVSVDANISDAMHLNGFYHSGKFPDPLGLDKLKAFYDLVRNGARWDYKQQGRQYERFGNFNFGATGTALGYSQNTLLRGAGWAQSRSGNRGVGYWWGSYPYGDDPQDSLFIRRGAAYYNQKYVRQVCK